MADQKTVESQVRLYGFIARAVENLNKVSNENITRGALQSRLENLENNWVKFQQADGDLYSAGLNESLGEHSYFKDDVFSLCEDAFLKAKAEFLDKLGELEPTPSSRRNVTAGGSESGLSSNGSRRQALPKIALPKFSGKYTEWSCFSDLFTSMVGESDEISPVEKLHYLKTNLTGEAAKLIANIPTLDVNFQAAWERLKGKFENKRALVNAQLDLLFGIKPLTRKSSKDLEILRSTVAGVLESLKALGGTADSLLDYVLVYFICRRLDSDSHEAWELHLGGGTEPPKYADLDKFLEGRARALETVDARPSSNSKPLTTLPQRAIQRPTSLKVHTTTARVDKCGLCGAEHFLPTCPQFSQMTVEQRRGLVQTKKLCFNCLGRHLVQMCRSTGRCRQCRERHHSMLHSGHGSTNSQPTATPNAAETGGPRSSPPATFGGTTAAPSKPTTTATAVTHHARRQDTSASAKFQPVLLATAVVEVVSPEGRQVAARALVDQGSELSFVCESIVQALGLPRYSSSILLTGVGAQKSATTRGKVKLNIRSCVNPCEEFSMDAHILPKLTSNIPAQEVDVSPWKYLSDLDLADPGFAVPGRVDLLLGANIYGHLLKEEIRRGDFNSPVAQRTVLGWIVSGPTSAAPPTDTPLRVFHCTVDRELDGLVRQFWSQEVVASPKGGHLSQEDVACEEHFRTTHSRTPEGRYVVRLPFKNGPILGGNSRQIAAQMYAKISRRFQRDPTFHQLYSDFMNEYLRLGHMEPSSWPPSTEEFFLPHHGVLSGTSSTTKLRVVFNGSQVTSDGNSLNDSLHSGPKLQSELLDVLLRWRRHAYVYRESTIYTQPCCGLA